MPVSPSARPVTRGFLALFLALAVAAAAAPVSAQAPAHGPSPQAPAHGPSPAAILLAKKIIDLKGAKRTLFEPLVHGVIEKVKSQFMQTNFTLSGDLDAVAIILEKRYAAKADEFADEAARQYASLFTEAELKDILAFYQTPVGRKLIVVEPQWLDHTMTEAGQWGDDLSVEITAKMRQEMKKRGHDI